VVLGTASVTGIPLSVAAIVATAVPVSFLLAVRLSRAVFGYERIVFYEKALFALAATSLALFALGHELGAGLDLAALGIGTFLALGRVGCLMVGCCYGRPSRWGIRYGVDHARAGFPWYYVGRRLFPLQIVDGLVSLVCVAIGAIVIRGPHTPGSIAAGWYLGYGTARFFSELLRGDAARPQIYGLSEAQWTAALVAIGIAACGYGGRSAIAVASILAVSALALAVTRRHVARTTWGLTSPWHVEEVHRALLRLDGRGTVVRTSHGLCVSLRVHKAPARRDYLLSFLDRPLPLEAAAALTAHVRFARAGHECAELVPGSTPGLVHLLVRELRRP
jgi:hypothetical protein